MCQISKTTDEDWQGDGWGIAWQENNGWRVRKSLKPVWEDTSLYSFLPETQVFAVHARSAGFPNQREVLEYNQPYIHDDLCFVFNGMIRGVKLPAVTQGKIGAQKIFSLLLGELKHTTIDSGLRNIQRRIHNHAQRIEAMNIGVMHQGTIYLLCDFDENPEYFSLRYYQDEQITLVCSEAIGTKQWKTMNKDDILVL